MRTADTHRVFKVCGHAHAQFHLLLGNLQGVAHFLSVTEQHLSEGQGSDTHTHTPDSVQHTLFYLEVWVGAEVEVVTIATDGHES